MAQRPIFISNPTYSGLVEEKLIPFTWYAGFSASQMQKSIQSLHAAATKTNIEPVLEISSKSMQSLGVQLSAFNLRLTFDNRTTTVESAYQGSKVFSHGGPFHDLYKRTSREAKTDERIKSSGDITHFEMLGERWELHPTTAFYDWLYLHALLENAILAEQLFDFAAYSDIVFNPNKSFSCQARSAAMYVALCQTGRLDRALSSQANFLEVYNNKQIVPAQTAEQMPLL